MNRTTRLDLLVCLALVAAVVITYRHVTSIYFLNEDFIWLRRCRIATLADVWSLLTRDVMGGTYSWRPLVQLSFGVNETLGDTNPLSFRIETLGWHIAATLLLYGIGIEIGERTSAAMSALCFALHPQHVESLAWTCARGVPASTALVLGVVLTFLRWRRGQGALIWPLLLFALALATQENAVVAPGLILFAELLISAPAPSIRRRLALYGGMLAIMIGVFWIRGQMSPAGFGVYMVALDPNWRLGPAALAGFILMKFRALAGLLIGAGLSWGILVALLVAAMALAVWLWRRGQPMALFGLLWIGIAFSPYSLLLLGPFARHLGLSLAGFGLFFGGLIGGATRALGRWKWVAGWGFATAVLLVWLGHVQLGIAQQVVGYRERSQLTRSFLDDLVRVLPAPRAGSTLAFYRVGDLRVGKGVFVFGLEDAVRLLYADDTLRVEFRALGDAGAAAYRLLYVEHHLQPLD